MKMKNVFLPIAYILFFLSLPLEAKENFDFTIHPALNFNFPIQKKWHIRLSATNQDILYQNKEVDFYINYLELIALPTYKIDKTRKISLGYMHRLIHVFHHEKLDEKRILLHYSNTYKVNRTSFTNTLKFEPRFLKTTFFYTRYNIDASIPLSKEVETPKASSLILGTEFLIVYGKNRKTALDQRFRVGFNQVLSKHSSISAGFQYRLQDYTKTPYHRLITQISYSYKL